MGFCKGAVGFLWCVGEGLCPSRGRPRGSPLRKRYKKCGEAGRCGHRPLRKGYKRCSAERNPPVTASPCQPPLGKGAMGTGMRIATGALRPHNDGSRKNLRVIPRPVRRLVVGIRNTPAQRTRRTDCHTSDIGHWFAMTHYKKCGVSPDGRTEASAPTECNKRCNGRATARVAPTEGLQAVQGASRCRHRPLRKRYKGCDTAGRCGERTECCRWQRKRGERVAAVKIGGDSRKAAQKFWAPQQGHRPLRMGLCPGQKTKSPPAFAKDDALHRGTTLLRGLLTQAAL